MANSFGLCRPSSGQNIYGNLKAGVVFDKVYILFHFNITFKHNGMPSVNIMC